MRETLQQVARERGGDTVDRVLLKGVVELFVEMGLGSLDIYRDGFETGFLQVHLRTHGTHKTPAQPLIPDYPRRTAMTTSTNLWRRCLPHEIYSACSSPLPTQDSLNYYSRVASENLGVKSLPDFLTLCDEKLRTETTRVANYLHAVCVEKHRLY